MKIEIKNFGPINHFVFDLDKDMHMIYGKNAVGKSYVAYCLYILLKNFLNKNIYRPRNEIFTSDKNKLKKVEEKIYDLTANDKNEVSYDITRIIEDFLSDSFSISLLDEINNSIRNSFQSFQNLKNAYSNEDYSLSLEFHLKQNYPSLTYKRYYYNHDLYELLEYNSIKLIFNSENGIIKNCAVKFDFKIQKLLKDTKSTKHSIYVNRRQFFGTSEKNSFLSAIKALIDDIVSLFYNSLYKNGINVYFLPASRSGLYQSLNAFTPILAQLSQSRYLLKNQKIELPALPEPLSDYFLELSTIDKSNTNKKFDEIIQLMENDIFKGKIEYDDENKKIVYIPNDLDLKLNLSEASSMVAELSPIVIFLRHIINRYKTLNPLLNGHKLLNRYKKNFTILFIEEPEAHLHPDVQVKMMEVFTRLLDLGIKVVMTSHSNYMMDKLTNLILDKRVNYKRIAVHHLIKTTKGTIVNNKMSVSSEGIMDDNFIDTTRKLYEERMDILEKQ